MTSIILSGLSRRRFVVVPDGSEVALVAGSNGSAALLVAGPNAELLGVSARLGAIYQTRSSAGQPSRSW